MKPSISTLHFIALCFTVATLYPASLLGLCFQQYYFLTIVFTLFFRQFYCILNSLQYSVNLMFIYCETPKSVCFICFIAVVWDQIFKISKVARCAYPPTSSFSLNTVLTILGFCLFVFCLSIKC